MSRHAFAALRTSICALAFVLLGLSFQARLPRAGEPPQIHDVAVSGFWVDKGPYSPDDSLRAIVEIRNRGNVPAETCFLEIRSGSDILFYEPCLQVCDRLRLDVTLGPVPPSSGDIVLTAEVRAEGDARRRNNTKSLSLRASRPESGGPVVLYDNDPPVHGWITYQAWAKLPAGPLRSFLGTYLPQDAGNAYYHESFSTDSWAADENAPSGLYPLLEGAWEEDEGEYLLGVSTRSRAHFWDSDVGYSAGLDDVQPFGCSPSPCPSAMQTCQETRFPSAEASFDAGDYVTAIWWLGRSAHLLEDQTVPAHALNDTHALNPDNYETYTATSENYRAITNASPNTAIPAQTYTPSLSTPSTYDPWLTWLFYDLNQYTNDFDSDDANGRSVQYGGGQFRFARKELAAGKTIAVDGSGHKRVEYWGLFSKIRDLVEQADYAVWQTPCEYRIYLYEPFYDEVNNTWNSIVVRYTDGSYDEIDNLDENTMDDVWDEPLQCVHQVQLQARAVGYVAALYEGFWARVCHASVSAPAAGATAHPAQDTLVTWVSQGGACGPSVALALYRDGSFVRTLAASTENDDAWTWTVPLDLAAGSGYTIRVTCSGGSSFAADSGTFTIAAAPSPKEASPPGSPMTCAKGSDSSIALTYAPGCGAADHTVYAGSLASLRSGGIAWTQRYCNGGASGSCSFDPAGTNLYFVIVANNAAGLEGSYGQSSQGAERSPAGPGSPCAYTQSLTGTCP